MLTLFKIAATISIVWFVAGLIGIMLKENGMKPNFGIGFAAFLTVALVGYMWDVVQLVLVRGGFALCLQCVVEAQ